MDAENTVQIFDWLWTSGQLSVEDIARLPKLGFRAVINLALPTSSNALPGEAEMVTRQGLSYVHIPVLWEQPAQAQLQQFFAIVQALAPGKVWVHCAMNMRVSAFVYLYRRLCMGEEDNVALPTLRQVWEPNATWQCFIDSALQAGPRPVDQSVPS
ncbi:protein tyrosine phosphatase family protein [Uliginosibacterium gangwonense]|uniref:protein tyrosine phosphatase family protein n=1 Tax=Uliginosibacterium gangwonense TaxID=392736 RepID=UPI0003735714|nr:protein tyrosine phosphatase family protein [Uliginosibacterium gangwonense]